MLAAGRRYQFTQFRDVIFTNIDEAVHFGNIYNFQKEFKVPLCAFGMGPRIPEDLEPATRERYIDLVFRITGDKSSLSDGNVKEGVICVGR
jgi:flagellar biosynthesis protein FlhF